MTRTNEMYEVSQMTFTIAGKWFSAAPSDVTAISLSPHDSMSHIFVSGMKIVLKVFGGRDPSQEAAMMRLVSDSVPVPRVIAHGTVKDQPHGRYQCWGFIATEFIHDAVPLSHLECEPTENFYREMERYVSSIRSKTMTLAQLQKSGYKIMDPFALQHCDVDTQLAGIEYDSLSQFTSLRLNKAVVMTQSYPLILSHCDLMPRNVLVSPNGDHVRSIIDWEFCSFCPDFFEFYKYVNELNENNAPPSSFMDRWLSMFMTESVPIVHSMERMIANSVDRVDKFTE